jgi:hypothetical protein
MVLVVVFARDLWAVMMVAKWLALDGPFVFPTPLVAGSVTMILLVRSSQVRSGRTIQQ